MRGGFAIIESHEAVADFPPQTDLNLYLEGVKKVYGTASSATFGATEPVSSVAGFRGLKVALDFKMRDVSARGFIFVARSATHFHTFLVGAEPDEARYLAAPVRWIEQGQIMN